MTRNLRVLAIVLSLATSHQLRAEVIAADDASNYSGFSGSENQGTGFGSWVKRTDNNAGTFLQVGTGNANSIGTGGSSQSWGLFANGGATDNVVVYRPFSSNLAVGNTFTIKMDNDSIAAGGSVGFALKNNNTFNNTGDYNNGSRFEFLFLGGESNYSYVDSTGRPATNVGFTSSGLTLSLVITGTDTFNLYINNAANTSNLDSQTGRTLAGSGSISSLAIYDLNADNHDQFFNSLSVYNPEYTGGAGNWSTAGNWQNGNQILDGNNLIFSGAGGAAANDLSNANANYGNVQQVNTLTFKSGAGAYTLSGNALKVNGGITNSSSNLQTVNFGITLGAAQTFAGGSSGLAVGGTVDNNGNLLTTTGTDSFSAAISGSGGLTVSSGTTTLTGSNSYTGLTTVSAGTLAMGASNVFADAGTVNVAGGILNTTGSNFNDTVSAFNMSSGFLNGGGTITAANYGLSGGIVNANLGAGTVTVTTGTTTLNGTVGGTTVNINSGTLSLNNSNRLSDAAAINVAGGTLELNANSDTVGAVSLTNGNITGDGGGTLAGSSYGVQNGNISTILGGTAALTKSTNGTVTLTKANTYTGDTTINAGTLQLSGSGSIASANNTTINAGTLRLLGSGSIASANIIVGTSPTVANFEVSGTYTIGSGQTLKGTGFVTGSLSFASGSTLAPGNSPGILTQAGDLTLNMGSTFLVDINGAAVAGVDYDQLVIEGSSLVSLINPTLTLNTSYTPMTGDYLTIINADAFSTVGGMFNGLDEGATIGGWTISYIGGDGNDVVLFATPQAVPEPSTWFIGSLVAASLLVSQRKRFAKKATV